MFANRKLVEADMLASLAAQFYDELQPGTGT